jgi:hypothetical protein
MRCSCRTSLPGVCFLALVFAAPASAAVLVQDGKPQASIVVAKDALKPPPEFKVEDLTDRQLPTIKIATAALELQTYLHRITGAKLPIVGEDASPAGTLLLVGRSTLTKPFDARIPSGLTPSRDEEGFLLLCKGDRIVLAGNDAGPYHGTEYAVAEFLHRLGVRWYMPGDYGEYLPAAQKTLAFADVDVVQKPDFKLRNWWGSQPAANLKLETKWKLRNKMNPVPNMIAMPGDSSTRAIFTPELLKKDAKLFGLMRDGKPDQGMPSLTNPEAAVVAAKDIKERFRKDPLLTSWGIAPDDGVPRDWSPEAVKLNLGFPDVYGRLAVAEDASITEEWIAFVNAIARDVRKEFPHHIVTTNGYANRNTPPVGMTLEPNVGIMFAAIWSDTLHAYDDPKSWQTFRQGQMIRRWAQLSRNVFMYNYQYIMLASAGTPVPLARKYRRDMPLLKKWGVIGFADEGRTVLAEAGIFPRYLRARLMWDAGADADAMQAEFFRDWYGAAARPGRAFWDALEDALEKTPLIGHEDRILPYVYTPALLAELRKHADEAARLAVEERTKQHVRADQLILEHLEAYMAMTEAEWACNFTEAVKQVDRMLACRKQLSALSPLYCTPDDATAESGFYYWGIVARKKYYQQLTDRVSGKDGNLVLVLPQKTAFHLDPHDEGRFAGWEQPGHRVEDWKPMSTTSPFYTHGHLDDRGYPYLGAMWYRFDVDVPAVAVGRKVHLYAPTVETEAWGWVNGEFVGHRPYHEAYERPNEIDWEVTKALQPGKRNVIVLRVHTGMSAAQAASGLISRLFLYAPRP